jgi:hypothetical protein
VIAWQSKQRRLKKGVFRNWQIRKGRARKSLRRHSRNPVQPTDVWSARLAREAEGRKPTVKGSKLRHFNWTPGIGDPTIGGWITVALYFLATVSCWITSRHVKTKERRLWAAITILFLFLGINKQLDLQSALTELGRVFAYAQGWYGQRQIVQAVFIVFVAIACVLIFATLLVWTSNSSFPTWLALAGTTVVIGFVLIRAASFHHIDRFIGNTVLGARWNWILEMGGICVVLLASKWRRRASRV